MLVVTLPCVTAYKLHGAITPLLVLDCQKQLSYFPSVHYALNFKVVVISYCMHAQHQ